MYPKRTRNSPPRHTFPITRKKKESVTRRPDRFLGSGGRQVRLGLIMMDSRSWWFEASSTRAQNSVTFCPPMRRRHRPPLPLLSSPLLLAASVASHQRRAPCERWRWGRRLYFFWPHPAFSSNSWLSPILFDFRASSLSQVENVGLRIWWKGSVCLFVFFVFV